jgi:hypothetical protein
VTRQRGGTTRRRDDDERGATSSAEDIGRLLKQRRQERELDLSTVHDRLHRPITQLEALESGDLASLPDQALALSTLRRYASLLELDGDVLALQMIDAWAEAPPPTRDAVAGDTGVSAVTAVVTAVATGPDHLRAFTQTGEVPKVGGGATGSPGGSGAYGYGLPTGPPTGTFPVVPRHDLKQSRRSVARARRRVRAPRWLKVSTWVVAGLVVVIAVGFGLLQWRSDWLVRSHILRVVEPGGAHPTASSPAAAGGSGTPTVVATPTSAASGTYTVSTGHFSVVLATSGRCWILVTSSQSATPLIDGVQDANKLLAFPAQGTMTVEIGSTQGAVAITVGKKSIFYDSPKVVPFTYTFAPASGS